MINAASPFILEYYRIMPRSDVPFSRAPNNFILVGSTDNTNWYQLDSRVGIHYASATDYKTFYVNTSIAYQYYRIITTKVGNEGYTDRSSLQISEFELYTNPSYIRYRLCDSSLNDYGGSISAFYFLTDSSGYNPTLSNSILTISGWSIFLNQPVYNENQNLYQFYIIGYDSSGNPPTPGTNLRIYVNETPPSGVFAESLNSNIYLTTNTGINIDISFNEDLSFNYPLINLYSNRPKGTAQTFFRFSKKGI